MKEETMDSIVGQVSIGNTCKQTFISTKRVIAYFFKNQKVSGIEIIKKPAFVNLCQTLSRILLALHNKYPDFSPENFISIVRKEFYYRTKEENSKMFQIIKEELLELVYSNKIQTPYERGKLYGKMYINKYEECLSKPGKGNRNSRAVLETTATSALINDIAEALRNQSQTDILLLLRFFSNEYKTIRKIGMAGEGLTIFDVLVKKMMRE